MASLTSYLQELRSLPAEKPLEPEFKNQDRQKQDQKIREDQDLRAGAIMTAVVEEGEGESSPGAGDLVSEECRGQGGDIFTGCCFRHVPYVMTTSTHASCLLLGLRACDHQD